MQRKIPLFFLLLVGGYLRADVVQSSNRFGLSFYKKLRAQYADRENLMVSPVSAFLALSMLYNGADGSTKTAISKVLESEGITTTSLNRGNKKWVATLLGKAEGVELEMANAIFLNDDFALKKGFSTRLVKDYQARIETMKFKEPATLEAINGWASEKTHQKIPKVLEEIRKDEKMFLLNATYFKGLWSTPFKERMTRQTEFEKADGSKVKVDSMSNQAKFRFAKGEDFEAVELPYGKEKQASMVVILPSKTKPLKAFESELTEDKLNGILKSVDTASEVLGSVAIPRFKAETSMEIDVVLSQMGMAVAFGPEANFKKMTAADVAVSRAFQKTFVEVNEKGTEAAAVTGIGIRKFSAPETEFIVDRPFLYVIRHGKSGALLFMGAEGDPSKT